MDQARIDRLSEGNLGAIDVLRILHEGGNDEALNILEQKNITGPEIWLLYKDICRNQHQALVDLLKGGTAVDKLKENRYSRFYASEE